MIGARFGPFEVIARLGTGGMGEVYRARDPRLGRDVAIKVLPAAVAGDAERLARFDREARALASLSHPNIGAIYGLEHANGQPGLVLELIEGPTLAEAIQAAVLRQRGLGALSETEALAIALQIAEALEAAHDRGITHRDLKPPNIKLADRGVVKILDFGLAKAERPASNGTETTQVCLETEEGLVLGTPHYMSPEQARGEPSGPQTDIWAFGCVLFEMLTGRPSFDGPTAADVMASVLGREPDWRRLPSTTSPLVRRLLARCLQKNTRERTRHIGDVRLDLAEAREARGAAPTALARSAAVDFRRLTDSVGLKDQPALSPDGKTVAFTAVIGGKRQIWIQLVAGGAALQLTRDRTDHDGPRWAPDASRLIYYAPARQAGESGSIWEMAALGGSPRRLVSSLGNGDISHDGRRLAFVRRSPAGVDLVVTALDGSAEYILARLDDAYSHGSIRWSPDDQTVAFARESFARFESRLIVVSAAGGEPVTIARADWISGVAWRPTGDGLIYSASTGSTMPYPPVHNLRSVDRDGGHDRQVTFGDVSYLQPDVQPPGHIVAARALSRSDIWLFPAHGAPADNMRQAVRLTHQTGHVQTPSISPDGQEFLFVSDQGGHSNLWIAAVDGSDRRQLTFERDPETIIGVAHWSPRGDLITFIAAKAGRISLRLIAPDGSGQRPLVSEGFGASWSPDGEWVYFMTPTGDIHKINVDDETERSVRSGAAAPSVARDGRGLFFLSRAREDWQVLRADPEDGPAELLGTFARTRTPFSQRFTPHLHHSPDGAWLALPLADGETSNIWRMPVAPGPMQPVTDFGDRAIQIVRWVSWTPDGRHIAAAVAETDTDIVWLEGLL